MDIIEYFSVKSQSLCGCLWRINWLWLGHVTGHYTDTLVNQDVLVKCKWNSFGIATFGGYISMQLLHNGHRKALVKKLQVVSFMLNVRGTILTWGCLFQNKSK